MFDLSDIIAYAVFTGFEFAALCAMTRIGRGWTWQLLGLGVLVGVDVLLQWWWQLGLPPLDAWVSVCFLLNWGAIAALTLCLSRECLGRRVFLSLAYGAYAVCFAVVFHLLAYRNVFGLSVVLSGVLGLAAVAVMNLAFIFWILPWMPRETRVFRWRDPCIAAGAIFANMFTCGLWPISAVTAPVRYGLAFVLASVAAWVAFPMLCRSMRERLHKADVERRLEQLMTEVKVRRAAIDEARRIRHDARFHRAQIAEYELSGQHEKVLAYLRKLDAEAAESPTDKLVWCGNETVNAVLSGCSRKAAAKGVELVATAEVEPSIPLPDVELVAVVANLVENAIDEVERRGGGLQKRNEKVGGGGQWNLSSCAAAPLTSGEDAASPLSGQRSGEATSSSLQQNESGAKRHVHCPPPPTFSTFPCPPPPTFSTFPCPPPPHLSTSSPQVTCALRQHDYGIGITVTNPVPPDFALSAKGLPCAEPGVGMESVRRIVKKRKGTWAYELKDGVLTCQVVLIFGD